MKNILPIALFVSASFGTPIAAAIDPPPLEAAEYAVLPARAPAGILAPFTISGGEVVNLPVSEGGPLPAQAEGYRVESAGLTAGPLSKGSAQVGLGWAFSISGTAFRQCKHVQIEDVSGATAVALVSVDNPQCDPGVLHLGTKALVASPEHFPWLYERSATIKVVRITIESVGPLGGTTILLQPVYFSKEAKAALIAMVK